MHPKSIASGGTLVVAISLALFHQPQIDAQQVGRVAVEARVTPPAAATALGRAHLVYEIHVTNFGGAAAGLQQLDVIDAETRAELATWSGQQLWQRLIVVGQPDASSRTSGSLPSGARAIIYLWLTLQPGTAIPHALTHRLLFADAAGTAVPITTTPVALSNRESVLESPVGDGSWVALRGPSATSGHRLSLVAIDGGVHVPQRFAVDFAMLGDDGRLFRGKGAELSDWFGYDAPIFAVADGTVALIRDGRPDGTPLTLSLPPFVAAEEATGNVVVIDIGDGRFATYTHLRAGTLGVGLGDRVRAGQLLGRIGSSGNSLAPHLHFQVSDAVEPLSGEGLPFALRAFNLVGRAPALRDMVAGGSWQANPSQPSRIINGEMPLEGMVVRIATSGRIGP